MAENNGSWKERAINTYLSLKYGRKLRNLKMKIFFIGLISLVLIAYVILKWVAQSVPKTAWNYISSVIINKDGTISTGVTAEELWEIMKQKNYDVDTLLDNPSELAYLMNAELVTQIPDMGTGTEMSNSVYVIGSDDLQKVLDSVNKTIIRGTDEDGNNCSYWVRQVFINAGLGKIKGTGARGQYTMWCHSSDINQLKPGMIIAVPDTRRQCSR